MERKEFLSMLGSGAAALFAVGCFGGCGSKDGDPAPNNNNNNSGTGNTGKKDFTLDLNNQDNSLLKTKGNALVKNGVIVAHTNGGSYIAVSAACTHQGVTVNYNGGAGQFNCPAHGSAFGENGAVLNGPATQPLKQYKTTLTGSNLRVFED